MAAARKPARKPPHGRAAVAHRHARARASAFDRLARVYLDRPVRADDDPPTLREALAGEPIVTPTLAHAKGGLPAVLVALRASDDPDAQDFLACLDACDPARDLPYLSWEELAVAAGVGSIRLYEVASSALLQYSQSAVRLIVASGMPDVVAKSMKLALQAQNVDDRMAMLKAGAVLPTPKGSQLAIQINAPAQLAASDAAAGDPTPWDQERQLRLLHAAMGTAKALPAAAHAPLPADVERMQERTVEVLEDLP